MIFVLKHFEQTIKFNELTLFVLNPVARSSKLKARLHAAPFSMILAFFFLLISYQNSM